MMWYEVQEMLEQMLLAVAILITVLALPFFVAHVVERWDEPEHLYAGMEESEREGLKHAESWATREHMRRMETDD